VTGAIKTGGQAQFLDKLQVERERGITVKVSRAASTETAAEVAGSGAETRQP